MTYTITGNFLSWCHALHVAERDAQTGESYSSSDSEEEMVSRYKSPYSKQGGSPRCKHFSMPKSLTYNGTTDWSEFERKYMEFIVDAQLSDTECLDALRWSLTGETTDYFDFIMKETDDIHFINALQMMEKRLLQTRTYTYRNFQCAVQRPGENLNQWASHISKRTKMAFIVLRQQTYIEQQAVHKFCHGCNDRLAAELALRQQPTSVDQAKE